MKKSLKAILGISMSMFLLASCGGTSEDAEQDMGNNVEVTDEANEDEVIRLGLMPSIGNIPLFLAEEQGYYEEFGVDVEIEKFNSAKDRDIAYTAEQIDAVCSDYLALATYIKAGIDTKIVMEMPENFILVASSQSGIETIQDLDNKTVLLSKNSVIEYTVDMIAEIAGLEEDSIIKEEVPSVPLRAEMLSKGEADAAILPEPFATSTELDGSTRVVNSNDIGINVIGLNFRADYIEKYPENVENLLKAYDKAIVDIQTNGIDAYEDFIFETLGYQDELRGNMPMGEFNTHKLPDEEDVTPALQWAYDKGLSDELLTYEEVIYVK